MKKTYLSPIERVVDLHVEDSMLITASQTGDKTTPEDLGVSGPASGSGSGGDGNDLVKGQNLWDNEW